MDFPWYKNYEKGIAHQVDLTKYSSVVEAFERSFRKYADYDAFYCMGKTYTFEEIDLLSKKFASYLQNELKLQKGDRVALMMPNILQYPIALFGLLRAGLVAVNVNPLYTARELAHQLNDSGAKTIIIFENSASILEEVLPNTNVENVLMTSIGDFLSFPKSLLVNFVIRNVKKMVPPWQIGIAKNFKRELFNANPDQYKPVELNHDDIAFLQYTGGTTGVSKGAVLTHGNIVANILQAHEWIRPHVKDDGSEIIITPLPLYHIFSLTANLFTFSTLGALNVLITNPRDIPGFIKEIKNFPFTAFTGVNTLFNALTDHPDFADIDFSAMHLTLGGGMAVQKSVAEKWREITKKPLIEAYGLTETSPAACINPLSLENHNGKIGLPISSTEVCIKNDEGENLAFEEIGEICIKGPQVMRGYWNRDDETKQCMTSDHFFRTGDIGFMDSEGFVQIVDRKKDMILVSGFNVYPNEVEEILCSHSKVFEAAVIGIPDDKSGEAVKAFIVKKSDDLTEEELKTFCRDTLTAYKVPRKIEFRDELPKSNVGKILRKDLRNE